jgi:hypothetical protein
VKEFKESVVWADGTRDSKRTCDECGLESCQFPVHTDYYRILVSAKAKSDEASDDNRVSNVLLVETDHDEE